ncbi:hypothetical protein METHPM2_310018 [Pseudomonas sp. PM2]
MYSYFAHSISAWLRSPVGAGLPAMAVCQARILQLNHRYRRQASSHSWIAGFQGDMCRLAGR